jgi:hypothetical protein
MPRSLIFAIVLVSSVYGGVWPPKLGEFQLKSASVPTAPPAGQVQVAEYGFESVELADYGPFQVTAWRFKDTTGAYAASLQPSGVRVGNYVVRCEGKCPKDLAQLADASLPHVSHGSIPTLSTYFPAKGLLPRTERYILGPLGLKADAPDIPAAAVNFDFGTEGEIAHYRTPAGPVMLAVFSFPLPSMARQQLPQFEKITGVAAKRTGPLVAVAIGPSAASAKLLDTISYQGVVAENEKPPEKPLELKPESAGKMVLAILSLAGLLLAFCLLSGLAVGAILRFARRFGYSAAEGSLITLHLEGK